MTATQRQLQKTLAPSPTVTPGTPVRLIATDLYVRSFIVEKNFGSVGKVHIAFSQADMVSLRRHTLYGEGDAISIDCSEYANLHTMLNLREVWIDGDSAGQTVTISYNEITGKFE